MTAATQDNIARFGAPAAPAPRNPDSAATAAGVERWMAEQMFEEDVRAVLQMMRPHGRERLNGWKEYRTGGAHFRVTVSWDDEFQITDPDTPLTIPHLTDVIEALLVGSAKNEDELDPDQEFTHYRQVLCNVYERLHERQACHQ